MRFNDLYSSLVGNTIIKLYDKEEFCEKTKPEQMDIIADFICYQSPSAFNKHSKITGINDTNILYEQIVSDLSDLSKDIDLIKMYLKLIDSHIQERFDEV